MFLSAFAAIERKDKIMNLGETNLGKMDGGVQNIENEGLALFVINWIVKSCIECGFHSRGGHIELIG